MSRRRGCLKRKLPTVGFPSGGSSTERDTTYFHRSLGEGRGDLDLFFIINALYEFTQSIQDQNKK